MIGSFLILYKCNACGYGAQVRYKPRNLLQIPKEYRYTIICPQCREGLKFTALAWDIIGSMLGAPKESAFVVDLTTPVPKIPEDKVEYTDENGKKIRFEKSDFSDIDKFIDAMKKGPISDEESTEYDFDNLMQDFEEDEEA